MRRNLQHPFAQHLPRRHRRRQTFEFDCAKVLTLEQAANLPPGGRVDHHLIRPGEAL
jgi:hypothetical protein